MCLAAAFAGCQTSTRQSAQTDFKKLSVEWDRAFNEANAGKLASFYADDAVSMSPNLPTITGRKALQADLLTTEHL